ncbi:MAG: hypothetical protein AAF226_01560, partial [Verrucomicrobiota bacterium]
HPSVLEGMDGDIMFVWSVIGDSGQRDGYHIRHYERSLVVAETAAAGDIIARVNVIDYDVDDYWTFVVRENGIVSDDFEVVDNLATTGNFELVVRGGASLTLGNYDVEISAVDLQGLIHTETFELDVVPPIVIDLDGDGVEFSSIEDGIYFDLDDDGQSERLAWASNDDGVLVWDSNSNGEIDDKSEFAFALYSERNDATDLEGLAEAFDSNGDSVFDHRDERWSEFKVWQDRDGDGQVCDGEFATMDALGSESISLQSDHSYYSAVGGDVSVHGEVSVEYTDGSEGVAADAAFSFERAEVSVDESFFRQELLVVADDGETVNLDLGTGSTNLPIAGPSYESDLLDVRPSEDPYSVPEAFLVA